MSAENVRGVFRTGVEWALDLGGDSAKTALAPAGVGGGAILPICGRGAEWGGGEETSKPEVKL